MSPRNPPATFSESKFSSESFCRDESSCVLAGLLSLDSGLLWQVTEQAVERELSMSSILR